MNAASLLKKELVTIKKDELIEKVCNAIRRSGYYTVCRDRTTHITDSVAYLSSHDLSTALDWIRAEGFRIIHEYKSYFIEL